MPRYPSLTCGRAAAPLIERLEPRQLLASVAGNVFDDGNANRIKDAGEGGIVATTVYIDKNNDHWPDPGEPSAFTDENGNYKISGLAAGTHRVRLDMAFYGFDEWTQTLPAGDASISVTLTAAQNVTGKNFGARIASPEFAATISGTVFDDLNSNGKRDAGEAGLASRYIYIDTDNDKIWDRPDEQAVISDSNGNYRLGGLKAGSYIARQIVFTGWKQTTPSGTLGIHVTVASRQNAYGRNFGNKPLTAVPANRTISGKVWNDADLDNVVDAGEQGKAHVIVYVDINKNGSLDFTREPWRESAADGSYRIGSLQSGTYTVRAYFPTTYNFSGWRFSTSSSVQVAVTSGDATNRNFGVTTAKQIVGRVWVDTDNDGVKDATEAALVGWRVFIDTDRDGVLDAGETSVLTDANGTYKFGVNPIVGLVQIRVVKQPGYTLIAPLSGYLTSGTLGFNGNFRFKTA